ncbi:MAG: hypothetical protein EHM70_19865, partial [Chloroflexota bacterium]
MSNRGPFLIIRLISLAFIGLAAALFIFQVKRYEGARLLYPQGLSVAGVPVGGLDRQAAEDRLAQAYYLPVELHYGQDTILLYPAEAGFELDVQAMLSAADQERTQAPFWDGFWDSLRGVGSGGNEIPLQAGFVPGRLRQYLENQVAARYDRPPSAAEPYAGTVNFTPGRQGYVLDIEESIPLIQQAMRSLHSRSVNLPLHASPPPRAPLQNLEVLLKQTISLAGYDGLLGLYLMDLQTAEEIHFLYQAGEYLPTDPDISFTASSTIKIPIMVSIFRRLGENPDPAVVQRLERMIGKSDNVATDWLVQNMMDPFYGPLEVTADMATLGLENTFWAGYFYSGAPLLQIFQTPANLRTDVLMTRDPYNQTTPSDMGMLLVDIYQCALTGGGNLAAVFPSEITQAECQTMIDYLIADRNPRLIQAGVPDGT